MNSIGPLHGTIVGYDDVQSGGLAIPDMTVVDPGIGSGMAPIDHGSLTLTVESVTAPASFSTMSSAGTDGGGLSFSTMSESGVQTGSVPFTSNVIAYAPLVIT